MSAACQHAPSPRKLRAASTRSPDDQAAHLDTLGCLTRLPHPRGAVVQGSGHALTADTGPPLDENTRPQRLAWCHDGMAQRWRVVPSHAALERAKAHVHHARQRAEAALAPPLFHLPAPHVETSERVQEALAAWARRWTSHRGASSTLLAHPRHARHGRPTPHPPRQASPWHIQAHTRPDQAALAHRTPSHACVVLGTHRHASALSNTAVIQAYQGPSRVEGGLRLRKDPRCFVAPWLLKKPCRSQGRLMVLTLAWLVYAVTQRRVRQALAAPNDTLPTHRQQPTTAPTVRWVFPLLEGMPRVRLTVQGAGHARIEGRTNVQSNVLRLLGEQVSYLYHRSPG